MDFEAAARRLRDAHRELHASLGRSKRDSEFETRWARGIENGQSPERLLRDLFPPEDARDLGKLKESPRYKAAVEEFWDAHGALYRDLWTAVGSVGDGDAQPVELLVAFLEADVWCYRSGYEKGNTAKALCRANLTDGQRTRLRDALVAAATHGPRLEFRETRKLARRLDSTDFRARLDSLLTHANEDVRQRGAMLLESCKMNDYRTNLRGAR